MTAQAIRSVLWQECDDFELHVVDDGSTDETPELAEKFAGDSRIVWTRFEKNRGQNFCRNEALRRSRGRFISFLDSDDYYLPGRLSAFKSFIERKPEAGFWFSNAYLLRLGRIVGRMFEPGRAIPQGKLPGYYAVGGGHLPYVTTNLAVARSAFSKTGFFREDLKILEDTELYARMLASGLEVGAIPDCLAVRRLHEGQITHDYARDYEEALIALASGGALPGVIESYKRTLALEVAWYYLKDIQPERAREFIRKAGGAGPLLSLAARLPRPLLRTAKQMRLGWLACAPRWGRDAREFRAVEKLISKLR